MVQVAVTGVGTVATEDRRRGITARCNGRAKSRRAVERELVEDLARQAAGDRDAENGHPVGAGTADLTAEQSGDDGAEKRRQGDRQQGRLLNHREGPLLLRLA